MSTSIRLSLVLSLAAVFVVSVSVVNAAEACGNNADKTACADGSSTDKTAETTTDEARARLELANSGNTSSISDARRHGRSAMARERIEQGSNGGIALNDGESRASLNMSGAEVVQSNPADTRRHGRSVMARERIEQGGAN